MQPPDFRNVEANETRKTKRAEAADSTAERDALAAEMRAQGATWQAVADSIGYANGAIARRAALRHQATDATKPQVPVA